MWLLLCLLTPVDAPSRRLRGFIAGSLLIAILGAAICAAALLDRALGASLLRFYWFRLADVAVPIGIALGAAPLIVSRYEKKPASGRRWLAVALLIAGLHVGTHSLERTVPRPPPADRLYDFAAWRVMCDEVVASAEIPPDARFITPRLAQTFKWYTGRAEVATWKNIPQDAKAIVEWRR